ncbi:thermonuclease family protein [Pseudoalteromonas sp. Q18-MNA-CIBAN-0097]|uniref:thermonuclease family protein n=1 Tax=Pseudoalteromonas sp. Q18-MNA-CIBAN-0097 TaxID=3140440 RepID=UPI003327D5A9
MKYTILILTLLFVPLSLAKTYDELIVSEIVSIYDGDTFRVTLDGDMPRIFGENISVRVANIDTPEIRTKCVQEKKLARKAKQFTVQKIRESKVIVLKNVQRGKYFRIVADVYLDGVSLSNQLLDNKLAVTYSGGSKKHDWCNIKSIKK